MIEDGRNIETGTEFEADIAIVGAGAAGITLALALIRKLPKLKIIVTEAGGTRFDFALQSDFFKGEDVNNPAHPPLELYRRRMFGGTTSIWGGRCIPMSPDDFTPRRDLGREGWPIPYEEVARFYPEALQILEAGVWEFKAQLALSSSSPAANETPSINGLELNRIERFSPPTDMGSRYRKELESAENLSLLLNTSCTRILTDHQGKVGRGLELKAGQQSFIVRARSIVLAAGGLETPRLLLWSRNSKGCGLGNESGQVGRNYMTHFAGDLGQVRFSDPDVGRRLDYFMSRDGIWCRRLLLLDEATRREHGLPNFVLRPSIPAIHDASHGNAILSAAYFTKRFMVQEYARRLSAMPSLSETSNTSLKAHAANILTGMPGLSGFAVRWFRQRILPERKLPSLFLTNGTGIYPLDFNVEQLPDPGSRVMLGERLDANGMPCLKVDWRVPPDMPERLLRIYQVMNRKMVKAGLGTIQISNSEKERVGDLCMAQGGHHIGTARMSANPANGVVDPDLQLWGTKGVYVLGSAVFPTCGFANPTLTIVALALRLAGHLTGQGAKSSRRRKDVARYEVMNA